MVNEEEKTYLRLMGFNVTQFHNETWTIISLNLHRIYIFSSEDSAWELCMTLVKDENSVTGSPSPNRS